MVIWTQSLVIWTEFWFGDLDTEFGDLDIVLLQHTSDFQSAEKLIKVDPCFGVGLSGASSY